MAVVELSDTVSTVRRVESVAFEDGLGCNLVELVGDGKANIVPDTCSADELRHLADACLLAANELEATE